MFRPGFNVPATKGVQIVPNNKILYNLYLMDIMFELNSWSDRQFLI